MWGLHELLNPVSVPAVGGSIVQVNYGCRVIKYRKSPPGMAFETRGQCCSAATRRRCNKHFKNMHSEQ